MCKCTPNLRTPFCGKYGCEWPKQDRETKRENFKDELASLINKYGWDNELNTPDYILAYHMMQSMIFLLPLLRDREKWFGRNWDEELSTPQSKEKEE